MFSTQVGASFTDSVRSRVGSVLEVGFGFPVSVSESFRQELHLVKGVGLGLGQISGAGLALGSGRALGVCCKLRML